jgi:hypothetical protein
MARRRQTILKGDSNEDHDEEVIGLYLWLIACQIEAHLHLTPVARVAPDEIEWREIFLREFELSFLIEIFLVLL